MLTFDREYFNLGYLDSLSYKRTPVHRLDPRTKLITTLAFVVTVVSFPKYEIRGLIPLFLFPVLAFSLGDIPVRFILKKVLLVSSFALFIGIFNPLLDRQPMEIGGGVSVAAGWISFGSIILKFILTITAALLLIATTSFPGICLALQRLGLPEIFTSQLLFLYRYLFVLAEEAMKAVRARSMRSFGRRGQGIKPFISLAGTLFLRTIERAERIYQAMLARGFTGTLRATSAHRFTVGDAIVAGASVVALLCLRVYDVAGLAGELAAQILRRVS